MKMPAKSLVVNECDPKTLYEERIGHLLLLEYFSTIELIRFDLRRVRCTHHTRYVQHRMSMIRPAQGIDMLRKFVGFCILGAFASPLLAQMTVAETLQTCEISPETLIVSECDVADFGEIVEAALENLTGRQELETRRDAWAQAKSDKQQLLEQLGDSEQSQDYEGVLEDLQTSSSDVEQAKASYFQYVDSIREEIIDNLSLGQQAKLELVIRPEVQVLPAEYRLLPWDARKLTRLTRAVRMAESDESTQHPLITAAEAIYDVQYARQLLLQNLESMKLAFDAL